jgi:hypothetical protein
VGKSYQLQQLPCHVPKQKLKLSRRP